MLDRPVPVLHEGAVQLKATAELRLVFDALDDVQRVALHLQLLLHQLQLPLLHPAQINLRLTEDAQGGVPCGHRTE